MKTEGQGNENSSRLVCALSSSLRASSAYTPRSLHRQNLGDISALEDDSLWVHLKLLHVPDVTSKKAWPQEIERRLELCACHSGLAPQLLENIVMTALKALIPDPEKQEPYLSEGWVRICKKIAEERFEDGFNDGFEEGVQKGYGEGARDGAFQEILQTSREFAPEIVRELLTLQSADLARERLNTHLRSRFAGK